MSFWPWNGEDLSSDLAFVRWPSYGVDFCCSMCASDHPAAGCLLSAGFSLGQFPWAIPWMLHTLGEMWALVTLSCHFEHRVFRFAWWMG